MDEAKEHAIFEKEHNGRWVIMCDERELGVAVE
jgi:hypothetical protein